MAQPTASPAPQQRTRPIVTRFLSRHLWSGTKPETLGEPVATQRAAYDRATVIVRVFYALSIFWVVSAVDGWPAYSRLTEARVLWPARWWFDWFSVHTSVDIIFVFYIAATAVAVLIPRFRFVRLLSAIALLQYMAFINGFDKINHNLHAWLFVSFILVLLPSGRWEHRRVSDRQAFLGVVWISTLVVLLFYTLTGFWKIYTATKALTNGTPSGFGISAFSYIVGSRLVQTNQDTVLGHYFTYHELPGWFLFTGTMYLETFSVIAAFRPRLHRVWGLALIAFHFGTQLAMGFTFGPNIVLIGLLLVCSPFTPDRVKVKEAILDLPVLYFISRRVADVRKRQIRKRPAGVDPAPSTA
jgi:hypothetical protein